MQGISTSRTNKLVLAGLVVIFVSIPLLVSIAIRKSISEDFSLRSASAATLPSLPSGWPSTFQLGIASPPGGADSMKAVTNYGFRYQYLSGGVNTGNGWANWNANGDFVKFYIQDSVDNNIIPVFTYYMLYQSLPGGSSESNANFNNLQSTSTMTAYYNDLKLFFQKAALFPGKTVVLHVEPDLWGYIQQRATSDNATTVSAKVGSTGLSELAGFPDNFSGYARAIIRLRDTYAPNVLIAYHVSSWATGNDIVYSDPSDSIVDSLGGRVATFFNSLNANYSLLFSEFSDRDAAFKQYQYGDGGAAWWNENDFRRNRVYLSRISQTTNKRIAMWQIPQGNTKMRAMNNTWNHYQDNRTEWFLDDPGRTKLKEYVDIGVIAFLFGRGADGATCACDANNDGVTNPAPINGNDLLSLNAHDDGGYFEEKAKAYYTTGAMSLDNSSGKAGDVDGDNDVDIFDLSALLSLWRSTDVRADFNDDGIVNIYDLSILLSNWDS